MARFNDAYLTDAGADLIAQSITDGVKIDFVRMEIGDGEYTEEEKSKDVLRKRTSLKNKRQESSFNSVEKAKDSAVKLKAAIDNRNVTNGYRMTEIGIFAKASGDTASDGVLYSIAVAVEADYMPPESTPITYIQEFYTKVGNAENVEITVSTGVYALAEDLAELEEPTYTESEALEELTPGESLKLALGKIAKAVKEIIAHMALKATGSVTGHVKVSSSAAVTDSTGMALAATEKNASLEGTLAYKLEQLNTNLNSLVIQSVIINKSGNFGYIKDCIGSVIYKNTTAFFHIEGEFQGTVDLLFTDFGIPANLLTPNAIYGASGNLKLLGCGESLNSNKLYVKVGSNSNAVQISTSAADFYGVTFAVELQ